MPGRTFILGVGAQKAGTTWLFRYLVNSPGVARGAMKEYHIWDALYLPQFAEMVVADADRHRNARTEQRWRLQRDPESYFTHFAHLLEASAVSVTCEVTPAYSFLPPEAFERIKAGFAGQGIGVKAIFLMRDPLQRCCSAARSARRAGGSAGPVSEEDVLVEALSPMGEARTRYEVTLPRLEAAFGPDRLHLGLYEEMHGPAQIEALSRFCGVPANPAFAGERVNGTDGETPLSEETAARIARHHRAAYEAAALVFPQVRQLWPGFRYL